MSKDILKPIIGYPNTICTETYILIGPFETENITKRVYRYIKTKFFHFMMGLKKQTQHTTQKEYMFVPDFDFNDTTTIDWDEQKREILDKQLYDYFELNQKEMSLIENIIPDIK